MKNTNLDTQSINTIRMLSADMVEKAKSGHPGMPMGASSMAYVLWTKFLKHNPKNPNWINRDRFVLSAGHGSALLYSLLHLTGYDLSLEDLKNFRQWNSKTPGHPEYLHTPGVETTTGPLGQGFATGVGMALAERLMANRYNRIGRDAINRVSTALIDYYIYGIVSDGDLMEGVSYEATSYAGNLKLGKLIYLYDDNNISIEGDTDITFSDDVEKRFESCKWHVQTVKDGNNLDDIEKAIKKAQKDDRPSLIIIKTHIGEGSPNKVDTAGVHGSPLGEDEMKLTRENLDWPEETFYISEEVKNNFRQAVDKGQEQEKNWNEIFDEYKKEAPELAKELSQGLILPPGWDKDISNFEADEAGIATRAASGKIMNAIAPNLPSLVGGSADLSPSNNTYLEGLGDVAGNEPFDIEARNLHFGVREHVMGSILNGLALSKNIIPYGGTFLIFSDYIRPAIRLAALMKLGVVYVLTHDSIGQGEDGPTHQPIEQLMSLRAIPNLNVIRPCDANEVVEAWKIAIESREKPTVLALSRQKLPVLDRSIYAPADGLRKGAYVVNLRRRDVAPQRLNSEDENPDVILIATGSEVHLALQASEKLAKENIIARVVSMPIWELFEQQSQEYKDKVLPPQITARVAIEAGATLGWYKYVGSQGKVVGLDRFGASAPGEVVMDKLGFNVENVVEIVKTLI